MRIIKRTAAAAAFIGVLAWSSASAQSFDGDDVLGFIAVMEGAEAIGDKYEGQYEAETSAISEQMNLDFTDFGSLLDEDGDFRVFRLSTDAMGRAGDIEPVRDYRQLVTANGFGTLQEFGEKADAIMMAWFATEMDGDMADMQQLDPSMMAMMPPGVRAQMEGVMKLMAAVEDVPAEDIAMLKPYRKKLKKALN